jgi:hypothetical protein
MDNVIRLSLFLSLLDCNSLGFLYKLKPNDAILHNCWICD